MRFKIVICSTLQTVQQSLNRGNDGADHRVDDQSVMNPAPGVAQNECEVGRKIAGVIEYRNFRNVYSRNVYSRNV